MSAKILIVDDDPDTLEFIQYNLEQDGFEVKTANNGLKALSVLSAFTPDLIILDLMMPEMDGIETCMEIRKMPKLESVLIAFLTARGEDYSQIAGLEAGADDYITKPVKPRLLISKINSLLRRSSNAVVEPALPTNTFNDSKLIIDQEKHLVLVNNVEVHLPRKQFEILLLLTSKPGKVFTRDNIMSTIWGNQVIVSDRNIDVQIRKLREKIGEDYIQTTKGVGYKFSV